jgi:hypothetical protein
MSIKFFSNEKNENLFLYTRNHPITVETAIKIVIYYVCVCVSMVEAIAVAASDKGASIYFIHGHYVAGCMDKARARRKIYL